MSARSLLGESVVPPLGAVATTKSTTFIPVFNIDTGLVATLTSSGQPVPVRITGGHRELRPSIGTSALILLVDDEEVVRRSTARLLRQAGHEVLEAPGGNEATQIFRTAERRPDLVILDLDMPVLTGEETQERLLELDPAVRILFVSGHDEPAPARHASGVPDPRSWGISPSSGRMVSGSRYGNPAPDGVVSGQWATAHLEEVRMAAMKPRTGDGPLEVTKEGRGIVMRVPLEGGGRLVVEMSPDEASALGDALKSVGS